MSNPNAPIYEPSTRHMPPNQQGQQQFTQEQLAYVDQQYAQASAQQQSAHSEQMARVYAQREEMRKTTELTRQNKLAMQNLLQTLSVAQPGPSQPLDLQLFAGLISEGFASAMSMSNQQSRKIATVKPKFFHGKPHEDLERWVKQIEPYIVLSRTHEDQKAKPAAQFLRGTAGTWFYNLKAPPATWEVLKELLQEQFELLNNHEKAMKTFFMNLASVKHNKGVHDLGIAFLETQSVIESDPDCQRPEKIKVFLHRNSIKHIEAAKAIVQKKPATLAEAIAIAVQMQNIVRTVETPACDTPARDTRRDDPMNLNAVQKSEPTESEKAELERRKADRLCLNCGKDGHQSTTCKAEPECWYAKKLAVWRKSVAKAGQKARQSGNGRRAAQKDGQ